jgi:hypothetical protein
MTSIDTNVANYTLPELMSIVELNNDNLEPKNILKKTNYLINKYKNKNPKLSVFFQDIQSQLLQYYQSLSEEEEEEEEGNINNKIIVESFENMSNEAIYPYGDKQVSDWYYNENLTQKDKNQTNKITDRKQKIQLFGNEYVPMNREQIATTDTYNVPVKQDSLNPNLKNAYNRFINLDSQFRPYTSDISSASTDYTCELSDSLKNVLKLTLYSYQIPFSWYVIDYDYGNTCLWITDKETEITVAVSVPPGNYSQTTFVTQLTQSFIDAGFTGFSVPSGSSAGTTAPVNYNSINGIITLYLFGGTYTEPNVSNPKTFTITTETIIVFYDFNANLLCNNTCYSKNNHYLNNTLGWLMGFRLPYLSVNLNGNVASSILDLNGTKYLILVIDDYNQNHVNNSMISISKFSNNLKLPIYYSTDLPYTCITPSKENNNLTQLINDVDNQNGLLIGGKYENDYTNTQIILPSAPRTLTNAQLYTINSINSNNNNLTNYLSKAPTSSDILAILPIKTSTGVPVGSLLVDFSGSLQNNERTYFGPVNIDRISIKLLDDKGNVLNLNGNDWCFTLIAECLYQY